MTAIRCYEEAKRHTCVLPSESPLMMVISLSTATVHTRVDSLCKSSTVIRSVDRPVRARVWVQHGGLVKHLCLWLRQSRLCVWAVHAG